MATISNLGGDNLIYSTPGTAAVLDANADAVLSGITVAELKGGRIKLHFDSGGQSTDTLGLNFGTSFAPGTVTLFLGQLYVNAFGVGAYAVGTVSGGASGSDLTITFNNTSNVSLEAAQILLRALTFKTTASGTPDRTISITVTDHNGVVNSPLVVGVNHAFTAAPTDVTLSLDHVAENTSTTSALDVGTLASVDANSGDTHSYSIVGGADAALFQIDTTGTKLQFKAGTALDYETKSSYAVTVRSTDSGALSFDKALTVTLDDANDAPVLALNTGASLAFGATATIANTALQVTDVDNTAGQLAFTIDAGPAHGSLARGQSALHAGDTFTQADLDAGLLAYANGGTAGADSFTFTVSDGAGGTLAQSSFSFAVGAAPVGIVQTAPDSGGTLYGTAYGDTFTGLGGRDVFYPMTGSDSVDGGDNIDTVVLAGNRSQYQLTHEADGSFTVHSNNADTTVALHNVERLVFGDQTLALDVSPAGAAAQRLYLAALARSPDEDGLTYYMARPGNALLDTAKAFLASPEYAQHYGSPSDAEFLTLLYSNALGRAPDAEGMAYQLNALAQTPGAQGRAIVLTNFVQSPEMQLKFLGVVDQGIQLLA
jgi:hypothetical protein